MVRWIFILMFAGLAAFGVAVRGDSPAAPTATAPATSAAQDQMVEFLSRRAALKDDDTDGRMDLARWCRDREMYSQLAQVAGEVLEREPDNKLAWSYMREVDDKVPLPEEPEAETALKTEFKQRFGHDFSTRTTHHFLLIFDTTSQAASSHCFNLEQAYDAFMTFFNLKTIHPHFLEQRLIVILFKDRDDYLRYAKDADGVTMTWSAGYYSQRTNRAAFFDDASSAPNEKVQALIDSLHTQIQQYSKQIDDDYASGNNADANVIFSQRRDALNKLTIAANTLHTNVAGNNTTKTIHEASHELAFNTGVQRRLVDYPFWLSEGLACCFEFEDRLHGMGPASINRGRYKVLQDALKNKSPSPEQEAALSLENLISKRPPQDISDDTLGIYYAHSWALFHYLYRYERAGLEKLLVAYAAKNPVRAISPEENTKMFEDAFGTDLKALDRRFLVYVEAIR